LRAVYGGLNNSGKWQGILNIPSISNRLSITTNLAQSSEHNRLKLERDASKTINWLPDQDGRTISIELHSAGHWGQPNVVTVMKLCAGPNDDMV
jgi:hypothetical protein